MCKKHFDMTGFEVCVPTLTLTPSTRRRTTGRMGSWCLWGTTTTKSSTTTRLLSGRLPSWAWTGTSHGQWRKHLWHQWQLGRMYGQSSTTQKGEAFLKFIMKRDETSEKSLLRFKRKGQVLTRWSDQVLEWQWVRGDGHPHWLQRRRVHVQEFVHKKKL